MVHDDGIALDNTVNCKIAAVASVGDLAIFKDPHCKLDSIHGRASALHERHCGLGCTVQTVRWHPDACVEMDVDTLVARLQVDGLVLHAVVSGSGMDEDAGDVALAAPFRAEHLVLQLRQCVEALRE